MVSKAQTES